MLNHQLPHHRAQLSGESPGLIAVLLRWGDVKDAARADENARAASVFNEGDLFRVEEAERGFRLQMSGETVQQRFLIFPVLDPGLAEVTEVGFALFLHVEGMFFAERAHIFAEHPSERNCWCGEWRQA